MSGWLRAAVELPTGRTHGSASPQLDAPHTASMNYALGRSQRMGAFSRVGRTQRDSSHSDQGRVTAAAFLRNLKSKYREATTRDFAAGNEVTSWKQDEERDQDQRGQKTSEHIPQPDRRNLLR
jgi:hypothetical protein